MINTARLDWRCALMPMTVVVLLSCLLCPVRAPAQGSPGQNALCSTSTCSILEGSPAFFDAAVFHGSFPDICSILKNIINGSLLGSAGRWPIQAVLWLEWGLRHNSITREAWLA